MTNVFTTLAHELWHAYDRNQGKMKKVGRKGTELGAIRMGNRIRKVFGYDKMRSGYLYDRSTKSYFWVFSNAGPDSPIDW